MAASNAWLTFREQQQIALAYQDGSSSPQLAEAYGMSVRGVLAVLERLGIPRRGSKEARASGRNVSALLECRECGRGCHPGARKPVCPACAKLFCRTCDARLPPGRRDKHCPPCKFAARYKDHPPRLCRVCGRMGARGTARNLCTVHLAIFCTRCDAPLPPARVNRNCRECEGARKERLYEKKGRVCAQCGERPVRAHASRCAHCLHEEYEVRRLRLLHLDRPCKHCGVLLPRGRERSYCTACQKKRDRDRRAGYRAIGAHRCAICKEELPLARGTYCSGCTILLANWRAAWHAGNPVARMLGTVREIRRWQQDQKEEQTG
jgi:hypothetical protein